MWHVGIDLHRRTVATAAVDDAGEIDEPETIAQEWWLVDSEREAISTNEIRVK